VTGHGAEGALMVAGHQGFFCHAPKVPLHRKIGAADALAGAFTLSLAFSWRWAEQDLKWGIAGAAATVGPEGATFCGPCETKALLPQCRLENC